MRSTRPDLTPFDLSLFREEREGFKVWCFYCCLCTNRNEFALSFHAVIREYSTHIIGFLPYEQIWTLYHHRVDAENRIKELKYDFGSDSFNQQRFYATEAALNFAMMAYNFISLLQQVVLGQKIHQQMKILRYNVFTIGGYIVKKGNQRIINSRWL